MRILPPTQNKKKLWRTLSEGLFDPDCGLGRCMGWVSVGLYEQRQPMRRIRSEARGRPDASKAQLQSDQTGRTNGNRNGLQIRHPKVCAERLTCPPDIRLVYKTDPLPAPAYLHLKTSSCYSPDCSEPCQPRTSFDV